jgi:hypothetical protein
MLHITCTNATSYSGNGTIGSGSWTGSQINVSTGNFTIAGPQPYQLTCSGAGGTSLISSITINVHAPSAEIAAAPVRVQSGTTSKINWTVNDVTSCSITKNGTSWKPNITSSGEDNTGINGQTIFTIACTDSLGNAMTPKSVTVNTVPVFQEF